MDVQIRRTTTIAASPPTTKPLELPLTIFDRFASNMHIYNVYAFSSPTPSNSHLVQSLSKTLLHFPTLAARLGGTLEKPCLVLGGDGGGVLLVEAEVDSDLEGHMPLLPSPELAALHPRPAGVSYLLQIQLNRFRCGGLILGVTSHHRVADGQSMSAFCVAWGKITRGIPISPIPSYDLSWLKPRFPPKSEFEHWGAEFILKHSNNNYLLKQSFVEPHSTSNILIHYSREFIHSKLKAGLEEKFTTFEVLLSHIWRKITIARALGEDEATMLRVSVNGRPRLRPPVAKEFFGNLVLNAYPMAKARELVDGGAASAARMIREAVRRIDNGYFQSFMDFGEVNKEEKLVPVYDLCGNLFLPNLEVDSWLGLQFEEVDLCRLGCRWMDWW